MEFDVYLASKRIDSLRFSSAEPELWQAWKSEFEQLHPNSFTVQKLNLINPIRRKYQLAVVDPPKVAAPPVVKTAAPAVKLATPPAADGDAPPAKVVPRIPRPGMPKPVVRPSPAAGSMPVNSDAQQSPTTETNAVASASGDAGSSAGSTNTTTPPLREQVPPDARVSGSAEVAGDGGDATKAIAATTEQTELASEQSAMKPESEMPAASENPPPPAKPARPVIPRPVIKPKPKPN